jgi:hypothetical protein
MDNSTTLSAYISVYDLSENLSSDASIGALEQIVTDMAFSSDTGTVYTDNNRLMESADISGNSLVNASLVSSLYSTSMSVATTDVNPVTAPVDTGFTLLFPRPLTESQLAVLKSL